MVGGLVALLVILGVFFMLNKSDSTADMVEVPDFTATANISEARVEEQLAAKGLKLDAREDSDSSEPKGTITKQNPTGGKKVAKGSTVSVWFSTGPQSVAVPDVSNKSQDDAKSILEAAGFKVGNVRTVDNASIEKDKVVSTDPAAHSKQTKGTIITLYISSGMTKIPDNLIGQPKDTVIEQLKQAGLTQITIESEYSDSIASGAVTRVEPGVGSTVPRSRFGCLPASSRSACPAWSAWAMRPPRACWKATVSRSRFPARRMARSQTCHRPPAPSPTAEPRSR